MKRHNYAPYVKEEGSFIYLFMHTYNDVHETISGYSCRGENGNDLKF